MFSHPLVTIPFGKVDSSHLLHHGTAHFGRTESLNGVTLCLNRAFPVGAVHQCLFPVQIDARGDGAQRHRTDQLPGDLIGGFSAVKHFHGVDSQEPPHIGEHAPHWNITQVLQEGTIGGTGFHLDGVGRLPFVVFPQGKACGGRQQGVAQVGTAHPRPGSQRRIVLRDHRFAHGMPVVADGVFVSTGCTAHNLLHLVAQPVEYRRIRPPELHLHGVRGLHRQVVFPDTDFRIGVVLIQIFLQHRFHSDHRPVVLKVDDQFADMIAGLADGPHQAVTRWSHPVAGHHHLHLFHLQQVAGNLPQVGINAVGTRSVGELVFHIDLVVVEVGEEGVPDVFYVEESQQHQQGGHGDGSWFVIDQEAQNSAHRTVGSPLWLRSGDSLPPYFKPFLREDGNLCKCQHPTEEQRYAEDYKEVAGIGACGILRQVYGQEGGDGDQGGPQQGHGRPFGSPCQRHTPLHSFSQIYQDAVGNHDGVVDKHPHGDDKSAQGNPLKGTPRGQQNRKRGQHRQQQSHTDDHPAAETHRQHQYQNNDGHRLHQVPHETIYSIPYHIGLEKNLLKMKSRGKAPLYLFHFLFHALPNLNNVFSRLHGG